MNIADKGHVTLDELVLGYRPGFGRDEMIRSAASRLQPTIVMLALLFITRANATATPSLILDVPPAKTGVGIPDGE